MLKISKFAVQNIFYQIFYSVIRYDSLECENIYSFERIRYLPKCYNRVLVHNIILDIAPIARQ